MDIESATRYSNLYFDLDSKDIESSYVDAKKLLALLQTKMPREAILVFFTGKKGFHIECDAASLGVSPTNNLPKIFKFIASDIKSSLSIESLDLAVYDSRRMWRLSGTKHQDTGYYKTMLSHQEFMLGLDEIMSVSKNPRKQDYPHLAFSYKANEWYREYSYLMEEEKEKSKDYLSYFNKYGTQRLRGKDDTSERVFQPKTLLEKCPAIKRIIDQASQKKDIDHESRLFLCSILSYTDDAIEMLHKVLSMCNDYNYEKSSAHINDWVKRRQMGIGGRPYTCERANSVGVGCGDCKLEEKRKWIKIGDRYMETNDKSSPSPVRFAYKTTTKKKDKKDG